LILGLTGGYCAGKNAVAALLEQRGWTCIDLDRLGHRALEACAPAVQALLGPGVLKQDGSLDRKAIGALVFADAGLLARYEAIVQPAMLSLLDEALKAGKAARDEGEPDRAGAGVRLCINAAILYKLPQARACDAIIEVRAPLWRRLVRSKRRDGLDWHAALQRIRSQGHLWRSGEEFSAKRHILNNKGKLRILADRLDDILAVIGASGH
jgi:dephospho-CoA kinase